MTKTFIIAGIVSYLIIGIIIAVAVVISTTRHKDGEVSEWEDTFTFDDEPDKVNYKLGVPITIFLCAFIAIIWLPASIVLILKVRKSK